MALVSNLYPPIVQDTSVIFSKNTPCRIYFQLSPYNSADDIKNVQISLTNLRTNASGFNSDIVQKSSGIKIVGMKSQDSSSKHYIEIFLTDMANGQFETGQFYKVQLRFTHTSAKDIGDFIKQSSGNKNNNEDNSVKKLKNAIQIVQNLVNEYEYKDEETINKLINEINAINILPKENEVNTKDVANWLYNQRDYFSQWSKIILIKGIDPPTISLKSFNEVQSFSGKIMLTQPTVNIVGKVNFSQNETDSLKSYNIKLYDKESNTLLYQTEEIYPISPGSNEINYELIYDFQDAVDYTFKLTYTTLDGYIDSISRDFYIIQTGALADKIPADINIFEDSNNGRIKVKITANTEDTFLGNIVIRRTSSQSQFHKWEDVRIISYADFGKIDITWYDKTIKSGVWYKYGIQKENSTGFRGTFTQVKQPVMCLFDDIFLTRKNAQLRINLNPSLNEFKYNVMESQQNPLGSKFPFIKRNSSNFFRTFPIGGLISSFMDTTDWYDPHFQIGINNKGEEQGVFYNNKNQLKLFTSKEKIYKNSKDLYKQYNNDNNINQYQDYIYEREFRQKVYDFLYANDVKLFKSTTEGNILIKLMNIDFQPMESLGRRLYSFTATAVQIDEPTILNFDKYGIQTIGTAIQEIGFNYDVLGQIDGIFKPKDDGNGAFVPDNIMPYIQQKQKDSHQQQGYIDELQKLKWVRIEITSPPYVIVNDASLGLRKVNQNDDLENAMMGYLVIINGNTVIIPPSEQRRDNNLLKPENNPTEDIYIQHIGFFELKGDNIAVTSLAFPQETEVRIDYLANFMQKQDVSKQIKGAYYDYRAGQLYDIFYPTDSVFRTISNKYLLDYADYYQRLINISGVGLSGPPKTTVYVRDSKDSSFNRHILENGFLQLIDEEASINGLYFCGVHLQQCTDPLQTKKINGLTDFNFIEGTYSNLNDIINPANGNIYQIEKWVTEQAAVQPQAWMEDNVILVAEFSETESQTYNYTLYPQYSIIDPKNLYTLLLDRYKYNYKVYFAYYYGCWYLLPATNPNQAISDETIDQFLEQFRHDIRYLRQDEYIITGQSADTFEEITDPIPNGVYTIAAATNNEGRSTLKGTKEYLINTESEYSNNILKVLIENSNNRCIYYKGQWCHFTSENDVLCPVEAIVDYYCEIEKGVYNNG